MDFAMIDCTEKRNNGLLFFVILMCFVLVLVIISINPCTTFRTTLGRSDNIILIKVPTLGKHSVIRNEEINARVY